VTSRIRIRIKVPSRFRNTAGVLVNFIDRIDSFGSAIQQIAIIFINAGYIGGFVAKIAIVNPYVAVSVDWLHLGFAE
jgi:hypothetical protein